MRKLIVSEHITLDGYLASMKGEMNWVKLDEKLFDYVGTVTDTADAALYGRVTFEMMEAYWPTAADKPNATKHDKEHSTWYSKINKYVISTTLQEPIGSNTTVIKHDISHNIQKLKEQPGKNIIVFGSPRVVHTLLEHDLIDEFYLYINPVLLGEGIPLFNHIKDRIKLKLQQSIEFPCGVIGLHYSKVR